MPPAATLADPGERLPFRNFHDDGRHASHVQLTHFNARRLAPGLPANDWIDQLHAERATLIDEGLFVERERRSISARAAEAPLDAARFLEWFEQLRESGPGQGDPLFPWLAAHASLEDMRWFLTQEAAGEAGFEDLVAITQVRFPARAKLEMARNYWDEMGRGHERGMHGLMLGAVVRELRLEIDPAVTVWESLALANLMCALAGNRRYAYHASTLR